MTSKTKRPYPRFGQDFSGDTKTQQHMADAADINNIVAQYDRTGIDPYASRRAAATYGDQPTQTYHEAMQAIATIESAFAELSPEDQAIYDNSPLAFANAIHEAQNASPEPEPAPEPVPAPEGSQEPPADPPQG
ncbi:MAG: DNA pilot protein [Microviridae sp.]|nr:MAG: DNA pilot protein [Microviridae sp.]